MLLKKKKKNAKSQLSGEKKNRNNDGTRAFRFVVGSPFSVSLSRARRECPESTARKVRPSGQGGEDLGILGPKVARVFRAYFVARCTAARSSKCRKKERAPVIWESGKLSVNRRRPSFPAVGHAKFSRDSVRTRPVGVCASPLIIGRKLAVA